jgi:hypothetical protein
MRATFRIYWGDRAWGINRRVGTMAAADSIWDGFPGKVEFRLCTFRCYWDLLEDVFMGGAKTAIRLPECKKQCDGNNLHNQIAATPAHTHDNSTCDAKE